LSGLRDAVSITVKQNAMNTAFPLRKSQQNSYCSIIHDAYSYQLARHNVGASYSNGPCCPSVCPSVCHTQICPKLSETDVLLLENSNRKPGFLIQNLPSDSQSEVRFRHFGCFRVGTLFHSDRNGPVGLVNVVNGSVGTVTSRHHTGHRGGPAIVTSHNGRYLVNFLLNAAIAIGIPSVCLSVTLVSHA